MIDIYPLTIDNRIYPLDIIKRAISDYNTIAKITSTDDSDSTKSILYFDDLKTDFELIKDEFCNYLIQLHTVMVKELEQLY